eukprot:GHVH01009292.1.p1 GENE.GHVH01009292.1~~GHVH01009292.1.p1  ORF type:complete len:560 (+),score=83.05 GHVH01009292.1:1508-3187(+)
MLSYVLDVQACVEDRDVERCSMRLKEELKSLVSEGSPRTKIAASAPDRILAVSASKLRQCLLDGVVELEDVVAAFNNEKVVRSSVLEGIASWHFTDDPPEDRLDDQLLGFVMSIKDSIYVKNGPVTSGLLINVDKIPSEDCAEVERLRKSGAWITTKGCVPQLLFSMETQSALFGVAKNPFDASRTAGGSSGGDAALVMLGFVNAGLGSDVAGSVRIPALCCGVHAFLPTPSRMNTAVHGSWRDRLYGSDRFHKARVPSSQDDDIIESSIGPIARSVEDLERLMVVLFEEESSRNFVPRPWEHVFPMTIRVALVRGIPFCGLCPTATRTLDEVVTALKNNPNIKYHVTDMTEVIGQELEEIHFLALQCFDKSSGMNDVVTGKVDIREDLAQVYRTKAVISGDAVPPGGRMKRIFDNRVMSDSKSVDDLRRERLERMAKMVKIFKSRDFDVILSPGLPVPACHHLESNDMMWICCYMYIFNYLMMPSGVLTTAYVRGNEQFYEDCHNDAMTESLRNVMDNSTGLPVGVSVSGLPLADEMVMHVMRDIERGLDLRINRKWK